MNERIKELMVQAGFDPVSIERMGVMPQAVKFAELIVKDCINLMWTDACHVSDLAHEDFQVKSAKIKPDFGIIQ